MGLTSPEDKIVRNSILAIEYYPSPLAGIPADKLLGQNKQGKIGIVRTTLTKWFHNVLPCRANAS